MASRCRKAHAANPKASGEQPSNASLFGLAPGGACLAAVSPRRRCALTAPFHLRNRNRLAGADRTVCCVISVALSLGFPPLDVIQHPALRCPDFPQGPAWRVPAATRAALGLYQRRDYALSVSGRARAFPCSRSPCDHAGLLRRQIPGPGYPPASTVSPLVFAPGWASRRRSAHSPAHIAPRSRAGLLRGVASGTPLLQAPAPRSGPERWGRAWRSDRRPDDR